jgi:O-antigen ligase
MGSGVYKINYWTGAPRYEGVYAGPHDMGHNMAFLIILATFYFLAAARDTKGSKPTCGTGKKIFLVMQCAAALFLVYQSAVRTVLVGLAVFAAILMTSYRRRNIAILVVLAVASFMLLSIEPVKKHLFPEAAQSERDLDWDASKYGSARPQLWGDHIERFLMMPIDRQLAGVGIGNNAQSGGDWLSLDTHNDFLHVLVYTGYVGFILFLALNVALLRRVFGLPNQERYPFLALFGAVMVMNIASNSYVSRFGLAQMYYILLAYIELAPALRLRNRK